MLPDGTAAHSPAAARPFSLLEELPAPHGGTHAVSDDATRIFFYDDGEKLYMRDTRAQTTTAISASQRAGEIGMVHDASFIAASHDGDLVFFACRDRLTSSATPGAASIASNRTTGG